MYRDLNMSVICALSLFIVCVGAWIYTIKTQLQRQTHSRYLLVTTSSPLTRQPTCACYVKSPPKTHTNIHKHLQGKKIQQRQR